tara:strand:- start:281 stop:514 length:234 start_codon:yes stop_codon:yes gene_type:complete
MTKMKFDLAKLHNGLLDKMQRNFKRYTFNEESIGDESAPCEIENDVIQANETTDDDKLFYDEPKRCNEVVGGTHYEA